MKLRGLGDAVRRDAISDTLDMVWQIIKDEDYKPSAVLNITRRVGALLNELEEYESQGRAFTVSYTNQAGAAGQTSGAAPIGSTVDLHPGDAGIRSVESITLLRSEGDPVLDAIKNAPVDHVPESDEERAAVEAAKAQACVFSVGDTVRLRSGGPLMTVVSLNLLPSGDHPNYDDGPRPVTCAWYDRDLRPQSISYPPAALRKDRTDGA